ncbi:autotransporter assembly complex protein TamA [Microvirga guangxiensis]|uniref:Autotransporter secretion outer membrane protein TamA n=1 Tax=Microvirga guangxiensis TaxID=549386 RepID=A0A1G5L531_9HYPH|nr:autotransporter assembly complex family protein [Microvirga guangxiensis]SCZ07380.1 autotransporter secretion outer membrane protein TamA [Microvirga guangxiensis]
MADTRWSGTRKYASLAILAGLLSAGVSIPSAVAFDFFGLFGGGDEEPPPPNASTLPYSLDFTVVGNDKSIVQTLKDASTLQTLKGEPPPDAEALVRRAEADLPRLTDALWGAGYYNARIAVAVGGVPLSLQAPRSETAIRTAAGYRARALVPVQVVVDPGPQFVLQNIAILNARTGQPFSPGELPPRIVKIKPGDPARAADIVAAQARIVDHFRAQSRPFAKVTGQTPVVVHPARIMDLSLSVDPGPQAGIGAIAVRGAENVDPAVVRSFIYTEPGDPYSPAALASMRKSILNIEALSSVRIREGESLDAYGNLPLFVDITERQPRVIGASVQYSTTDGPAVRAYWAHRNLFGGAERLRLEGSLFYLTEDGGIPNEDDDKSFDWDDLGGRFTASFLKPALWGTRNDFLADVMVERDRTESYTSRRVNGTAAIRHRFSETFSIQGGIEYEKGQASDILGQIDYTLVGLPLSVTYDSTDNTLDPTRGMKLLASVTPYPEFLGSSVPMTIAKGTASAYWSLDEEARYVLAGRLGLGSIIGADLDEIPANRRFYAGGGGSVRGFGYRTLSPKFLGEPIGGRSLLEASLEARIKITDTIGIVPFVDAGTAFESSYPDFDDTIRVAAGLGLRYYTAIGPIRLDVATPIRREPGDDRSFAIYVGIGQAF